MTGTHPGGQELRRLAGAEALWKLSRRGLLAAGLGAAWALPTWAQKGNSTPGFFDVHTHLGQTWNTRPALSPGELLRWMDAHGVERAVVLPLVSPEASSYLLTTEFVLRVTRPHRDRLIPFCAVDPRTSYQGGRRGLRDMLRRYQDQGCRGFGEHKPGVAMDDPRNLRVFEVCGELGLPVLLHLDNQRNWDRPGLPALQRVLKRVPHCIFIGHGPGWWANISAQVTKKDMQTYPRGPVVPGGAIDRLMEKFPNLYGDLSAGSGANAIARDLKFGREFLIRRADRLLFGTDFLYPGQPVPQFELMKKLQLPQPVQQRIFYQNAQKLLKLST